MTKFKVLCRVETLVDTVAYVEASSALEAVEMAHDAPHVQRWTKVNEDEVAVRYYVALDENGGELEATRVEDI